MGLLPDGERPSNTGKVVLESNAPISSATGTEKGRLTTLLNSLPFWLLSAGFFLGYAGENAILVHEVPFATDMGIPAMAAAVALGFTGGIGGIGKVVLGWLTDKLSTRYVVLICFTIQIETADVDLFYRDVRVRHSNHDTTHAPGYTEWIQPGIGTSRDDIDDQRMVGNLNEGTDCIRRNP